MKSPAEYRRLCDDFNCDPEVIDRLARFVTSPSLTLQRSEKQEKEDTYLVSEVLLWYFYLSDDASLCTLFVPGTLGRSSSIQRAAARVRQTMACQGGPDRTHTNPFVAYTTQ